MNPEDTVDTSTSYSGCCEPAFDATPVIEEPFTPDPAPVVEEPVPVVEEPTPDFSEVAPAAEPLAPPEPNFQETDPAPAPDPSPAPAVQTPEPNTATIGGPEPDEFAELRQTLASNTVVGGPAPEEFTDLGQTLANSTVVGGPVPNEFANLSDHGWVGPRDDLLVPNPNRAVDPNAALFAPQAWHQWGDAMGQLDAAALNAALLGPADHTAQYSSSLGIDWVENGRDHV
jgi:hypothetical protein